MIRRPKPGEDEEDILRFQEEFLASQQKPAVNIKRVNKPNRDVVTIHDENRDEIVKKSVSESSYKFPNDKMKRFKISEEDMDPRQKLDAKDKQDITEILTNIQEHDMDTFFQFQADCYKNGFPKAPVIKKDLISSADKEMKNTNSGGRKKKSLFAQQYSLFNKENEFGKTGVCGKAPSEKYKVKKDIVTNDSTRGFQIMHVQGTSKNDDVNEETDSADNIQGSPESIKDRIHQENVLRLKAMDEKEILEEQKKLFETLDPKTVKFLMSRSQSKKTSTVSKSKDEDEDTVQIDAKVKFPADSGCSSKNSNIFNSENVISEEVGNMALEASSTSIQLPDEKKDSIDDEDLDPHKKFGIKKDFVNMDVVEQEKLAWMKDIPKIELKEGNIVPRFDFEGMLIDPTADIPVDTGLHHHGDEPTLPGYTLEELFHLARSNFPKQRVFSLEMIGRIFEKYHQHEFVGKLSADLLTKCLDAGLMFMLRWSLDEQTEQTFSAAVAAITNVIYIKNDQKLAENYLFADKGHLMPSLCTYYKKSEAEMTEAEQQEVRDLTDAELLGADLIKGLLQIQIIPRLRYIIEFCNPSIPAVNNCLSILIRMTQHNHEVAHEVFKNNELICAIFKLLSTTETKTESECKEETRVLALRLVRCFCQASKSIALDMINRYKLHEIICAKFTSQESVSSDETFIQVCHIWSFLLRYGVCTSLVRDLYSVIMGLIQQYFPSYKKLDDKLLASITNLLEVAITCTSSDVINWSLIEGFFPVVHTTLRTIEKDMFKEKKVTHPYFISALLQYTVTYYKYKNTKLSEVNPVDLLDEVQQFWNDVIQPILSSPLLNKLLEEMRLFSDFKSFKVEYDVKCPQNLPSFGTYCLSGGGLPPSLNENSPMVIIQALFKLVFQLANINKTLVSMVLPIVIAPETLAYLKFILESQNLRRCSILVSTKIEVNIISSLMEMFYLVGNSHGFSKFGQSVLNVIQEVAIQMICFLQKDDMSVVKGLLKKIVFNQKIFRKQTFLLWLSEYYENNLEETVKVQLEASRKNLQYISTMYQQLLIPNGRSAVGEISSFYICSLQKKAVPSDWMFYPLVHFYNESINVEQDGGLIASANPEVISMIRSCLEFIVLVEVTRPALVNNIPATIRFTRLLCLFMTEGLLFNEKSVKDHLNSLVAVYAAPSFQSYLNFESAIPGITSFIDLYKSVVNMYISASFSDYCFANILLFPLQLQHDVKYRILLWTEFYDIMRIFPLPLNQVICDIKKFLAAENEDMRMIRLYFQGLIGDTCKESWCPLFYLIAVHHVNHFIFSLPSKNKPTDDEEPDKRVDDQKNDDEKVDLKELEMTKKERDNMLNVLLSSPYKTMMEDVILYNCFDINCERGISKFKQLPPSRDLLIRSIKEDR